ncbi:MAG: type II secretion system F family protein [Solirubrobacterales bacterium]
MVEVIFSFLITIVFTVFFFIYRNIEKERKVKGRIDSYVQLRDQKEEAPTKEKKKFSNITGNFKSKLRKYYNNNIPSHKEEEIQKKLLTAGNPFKMTVADYYIINNLLRISIPLLFCAFGIFVKLSILKIAFMVVIGVAVSIKTMDIYIYLKAKERNQKALRELPDFLDILTISVEAGLGFDLALTRTIDKRQGILCTEFHTCLEEMRLGKSRREALVNLKERLAFDEMISFINSIIQSERLGTGIVQTLRARSEDERDKRKQRAEEQAMKTTIKILFPLVFFIFPSIFIILLGPAIVQIAKTFGH